MKNVSVVLKVMAVLAVLAGWGITASAENTVRTGYGKWHRGAFGVKGGIINAGTFRINGEDWDSKVGLSGGVFFEVPLGSRMLYSFSADLHDIQILGERQAALEVGLALKYPIYKTNSKLALKPGLLVGFAYLGQMDEFDPTTYLTLRASFEVTFFIKQKHAWLAELAIFGAPTGGNNDYDVTFGPTVMVRAGVLY